MKLPVRKFQGGQAYNKFLDGKKLTRKEAMLAHCYECMGGFEEGKQDCMANPVQCISIILIKVALNPPNGLRSI